jgi:hypothetical protein
MAKVTRVSINGNGTATVDRKGTTRTEYRPTKASKRRIKRIGKTGNKSSKWGTTIFGFGK